MGTHEDVWLRCSWCAKRGKCLWDLPPDVPTLFDVSPVTDACLMCDACLDRQCPPHYEYLQKILGAMLDTQAELLEIIAAFAYPIVAKFTTD